MSQEKGTGKVNLCPSGGCPAVSSSTTCAYQMETLWSQETFHRISPTTMKCSMLWNHNIRRRLAAAVSAPNACIDALRDHVY
ncbi:unnamed protein product [Gadus morhua 'NCC']